MRFLILILFLTSWTTIFGQQISVNYGVDTTNAEIKEVIALWSNYLKSKPDVKNIRESPYWANTEKIKYSKVDQLLHSISSETSTYSMGNATILYVKPGNNFYEIKTLFAWADSLQEIRVLSIISVFAKKENGKFRLYNALTVNSTNWKSIKISDVTFYFPGYHQFSQKKANDLINSIRNLRKQWNLKVIPIDYYFANTYEEVQHLRGLDYAIGMGNKDKPAGMADDKNNIIYCGGLGENYFHEVVHIYLNHLFPSSPLQEGLAVFYGGSMGHSLKWHLAKLNQYLNEHPEIDLTDFRKLYYMDNFTNPRSTIQGLLCDLAYKKGGVDELKRLMTYKNLDTAIETEFNVKKNNLNDFLRSQIKLNID